MIPLSCLTNPQSHLFISSSVSLTFYLQSDVTSYINQMNKYSDGLGTRGTSSVWQKCDNLDKHSWLTAWTKKIQKIASCFDANKVISVFNIIIINIISVDVTVITTLKPFQITENFYCQRNAICAFFQLNTNNQYHHCKLICIYNKQVSWGLIVNLNLHKSTGIIVIYACFCILLHG